MGKKRENTIILLPPLGSPRTRLPQLDFPRLRILLRVLIPRGIDQITCRHLVLTLLLLLRSQSVENRHTNTSISRHSRCSHSPLFFLIDLSPPLLSCVSRKFVRVGFVPRK